MRKHLLPIATVALILLLLGAAALAQPSGGSDPPTLYAVERGTASGGPYHLASLSWQVDGTTSSSGYRLLNLSAVNASPPPSAEVGCCCTYLPCALHDFP